MDTEILYFIQENLRSDSLNTFFRFITSLGDAGWLWIALTAILLIFKRTRRIGIRTSVSLTTGFIITNVCLKNFVKRIRPYNAHDFLIPITELPSDYSFPSGHTCASFAAAFVLYRAFPKKYSWLFLLLAALIAFSRLYLGVHYPTDVLAGFVIGWCSAYLAEKIVKKNEGNYN